MKRSRVLTVAVLVCIACLFPRQFHNWRDLQWSTLWHQLGHLKWPHVIFGLVLFYVSFFVRAWRWKLFLKNTHATSIGQVLGPTFIGFTAVALVGGPGELIRPYLTAKKGGLTVSSQMGVWTLERVFDIAAFALLLLPAVLFANVGSIPYLQQFRRIGLVLIAVVAIVGLIVAQLERHGARLKGMIERALSRTMPRFARRFTETLRAFGKGLNTVADGQTLFQLSTLSVLLWAVITLAYYEVLHSFPPPLETMPLAYAPLALGFAILGSLVQLPAGATSQLMVIAALLNVFRVPGELAVSCGIALWLGAYIAPVPVGLLYLHHEHLSLRGLALQMRALRSEGSPVREAAAISRM